MWNGAFSKGITVLLLACAAVAVAGPARVIYVDGEAKGAKTGSSWADACDSLQDALAAAADKPVEIRVAQGTYRPDQGVGITPGDQAATFQLLNGVTIKGGYAGVNAPDPNARDIEVHETILSGDLSSDGASDGSTKAPNSQHVVTSKDTDRTAVMDGFTVTAFGLQDAGVAPRGANMLIDAASPTVRNCRFMGSRTGVSGATVMATRASSPLFIDCAFLNGSRAGFYNWDRSNSVLTNCRSEGNRTGIDGDRGNLTLTGCRFIGNHSRGIDVRDCNAVVTDCVFEGGAAERDSGIRCIKGNFSLTDCTFTDLKGEGIDVMMGGNVSLAGCTFTRLGGECVHVSSGDLSLVGCVFKDNSSMPSSPVRSYSKIVAKDCTFAGNTGWTSGAISGGPVELDNCEFTGNSGGRAGAIDVRGDTMTAIGCLFAGNSSQQGAGAISGHPVVLKLSNCTFVSNRGTSGAMQWGSSSAATPARLTQCVIWDCPNPFGPYTPTDARVAVTYSDVQGGYPGEGNIDVDPCFVDPGYWGDPNDPAVAARPGDPCAVWVAGDCHLKSQGGHWDRATGAWLRDDVTSDCIDAGDPNAPVRAEPFPNGGFVNIGAYGGTVEASKSYFGEPICETQFAGDLNGDCKIDQADMDILMLHWLMDTTGPVNQPPTITLLSPVDGAELTYPTPIVVKASASDPDGTIAWVSYTIEYRSANSRSTTGTTIYDPTDDWDVTFDWSRIHHDGTHTIWAETMDNEGTRVASPKITVTLHRAK